MTIFFSVDVETSGLTPATGYLLTVGIQPVEFHLDDPGEVELDRRTFYARIQQGGRLAGDKNWRPGKPTYDWWHEQSQYAQDEAYEDDDLVRHDDYVVARMIAEFVREVDPDSDEITFVANPVAFDKMWLTTLFDATRVADPFHYRSLCLRSMKFGLRRGSAWGGDRETHDSQIPHHALFDAIAQARDLEDMLLERDYYTQLSTQKEPT